MCSSTAIMHDAHVCHVMRDMCVHVVVYAVCCAKWCVLCYMLHYVKNIAGHGWCAVMHGMRCMLCYDDKPCCVMWCVECGMLHAALFKMLPGLLVCSAGWAQFTANLKIVFALL